MEAAAADIFRSFNQGETAPTAAIVSAMEKQEEDRLGGDETARDKSLLNAKEAQIDVNMDTNYDEYKRQADALVKTIKHVIRVRAPTKERRAECKAAYNTLRKLLPFGAKNKYMFQGVFFKYKNVPQATFSDDLKRQIRNMPEYKIWHEHMVAMYGPYQKWLTKGPGKETTAQVATATEAGLEPGGGGKRRKDELR